MHVCDCEWVWLLCGGQSREHHRFSFYSPPASSSAAAVGAVGTACAAPRSSHCGSRTRHGHELRSTCREPRWKYYCRSLTLGISLASVVTSTGGNCFLLILIFRQRLLWFHRRELYAHQKQRDWRHAYYLRY